MSPKVTLDVALSASMRSIFVGVKMLEPVVSFIIVSFPSLAFDPEIISPKVTLDVALSASMRSIFVGVKMLEPLPSFIIVSFPSFEFDPEMMSPKVTFSPPKLIVPLAVMLLLVMTMSPNVPWSNCIVESSSPPMVISPWT